MTKNEIVGRLKDGGLDASSTNRRAAVYVADAIAGRAVPGWFAFRIVCDSEDTERRARAILSRWYDIDVNGNVWRLRSKNRVPLMAIKRGGVPPTPPTPTGEYMYFEAVQANSTVSLMSMLTTAPDFEYSTDGVTWQEWQHTTADNTHTFDTLTLTAVGDRVYLRGDNPNGLADLQNQKVSIFLMSGKINAGGNIMSLLDKTMVLTAVPVSGFATLFGNIIDGQNPNTVLLNPPAMDTITSIGDAGCIGMYSGCTSLTAAADMPLLTSIGRMGCARMYEGCSSMASAADMPSLTTIGSNGCTTMYASCTFNMSDDGTTFNFDFGVTPPVTIEGLTYNTYYDLAELMGNTNGFTTP